MCTTNGGKVPHIESEYIPVNKTELVSAISTHTDVDLKTVATVLGGLEDVVSATVKKGEKVAITGFASFDRWSARLVRRATPRPVSPSRSRPPRLPASRLAPPSRRSSTARPGPQAEDK